MVLMLTNCYSLTFKYNLSCIKTERLQPYFHTWLLGLQSLAHCVFNQAQSGKYKLINSVLGSTQTRK